MKLELYYYDQCPFCHFVAKKIQSLGLQTKINFMNTLENPEHRQFHINKTGRTTVPCLYIDDEPMFESSDICQWLEENKSKIL
jgi:glutathione S-transferase